MKKLLLVACALLAFTASSQLKNENLPASVRQFYMELHGYEAMKKLPSAPGWAKQTLSYAEPRMINGVEMIDAFIDITSSNVIPSLKSMGVKVNCEFDGFVTAQIPMKRLDYVCGMPGVTNVEISRIVNVCTDSTLSVTHAGQVLNGTQNGLPGKYDGTGVIVGIVDYGFNYNHRAFKRPDNLRLSRVVRVYNTADDTGHPVILNGSTAQGTVFMGAQIDTMTTDDANAYHGTHTACIAAGTHVNGYGGMAPGADIVMCAPASFKWGFLETEVINCIKYIYSYADSVGKPCVVSMSVSTIFGPHDGKDRFSKAISQMVGPGRVFVIAAGNNGSKNQYAYGTSTHTSPLNILLGQSNSQYDEAYYYRHIQVDTWVRQTGTRPILQYIILDKQTRHIVWKSDLISSYAYISADQFSDFYEPDPANGEGYLEALISLNPNNSKFNLATYLHNLRCKSFYVNSSGTRSSRYQFAISIYPPSVNNPRLANTIVTDSWICSGNISKNYSVVYVDDVDENGDTITTAYNEYFRWPLDYVSIGTYAVADSVISAGGYVGRNSYYSLKSGSMVYDNVTRGQYYVNSSYEIAGYGPTGKALPTVTAPSVNVVAAVNNYNNYACYGNQTVMRDEYYNHWGVLTGTSMAAPTVAGIIAQWLQINPNLSPGDIKKVIAETSIKDSFTMNETSSYRFGPNGKIDALAGAKYLAGEILRGDVNGDGVVDISDLPLVIDYLLGGISEDSDEIIFAAIDFNQDGVKDIIDVSELIEYLISQIHEQDR